MGGKYLNWPALKELKLRWTVSFTAVVYRARNLDLLTADQAKSGFTYLARKGFTKSEEFDELIPLESPLLVQRAIDLLDFATWSRVLDSRLDHRDGRESVHAECACRSPAVGEQLPTTG